MMVVMCTRDLKVGAFTRPFFVQTVGIAVRAFSDEVRRSAEDNPVYMHPEDFELFELGKWDEVTAKFDMLGEPRYIIRADLLLEGDRHAAIASRRSAQGQEREEVS